MGTKLSFVLTFLLVCVPVARAELAVDDGLTPAVRAKRAADAEALDAAMRKAVGLGPRKPASTSGAPGASGLSDCRPTPQEQTRPLSTDTAWFTDADSLEDRPLVERVPEDRKRFCRQGDQEFINNLKNDWTGSNSLSFENPSGDFGTGLCWMHSRFQRASTYLADFHPEKDFPEGAAGEKLADQIIDKIVGMREVIPIPGFSSMRKFSERFRGKIERKLNTMAYECVGTGECTRRFSDRAEHPSAELMRTNIDELARSFGDNNGQRRSISFARMECSDFGPMSSHSALIVGMDPIAATARPDNPMRATRRVGYTIKFIDPNLPGQVQEAVYRDGMTSLDYNWDGKPVKMSLFPDYDGDVTRFDKAFSAYCKPAK